MINEFVLVEAFARRAIRGCGCLAMYDGMEAQIELYSVLEGQ